MAGGEISLPRDIIGVIGVVVAVSVPLKHA